jgi:glycine cleavage system H protein
MYPPNYRYTKDHEWISADGPRATVGITDYAQRQLGDVVYVELPELAKAVAQGQPFGTIESVKAVSELYSPAAGRVVEINTSLTSKPETINSNPHGTWIIALELSDPSELDHLLTAEQYAELVK